MDIKITPFNITNAQALRHRNSIETATTGNTQHTSNLILPNYKNYFTNISFGRKTPEIPAPEFMLPPTCTPDMYQINAAMALKKGAQTIVTAPTGTGKTAIAHYIIKKNFEEGKKTFYTTPLKALSNQKYQELQALFGKENTGILTGDRKENVHAPIVIMTTEIYHNMVSSNYFGKENDMLKNLGTVVYDEFHYMSDSSRGHVWEESIMFTPAATQILALSATVGNSHKIEKWINNITCRPTKLINVPIEARHVPLKFSYLLDGEISNVESSIFDIKALETAFGQKRLTEKQDDALGILAETMGYKNKNKGKSKAISCLKDKFGKRTVSEKEVAEFLKREFRMSEEIAEVLINALSTKNTTKASTSFVCARPHTSLPKPSIIRKLIRDLDNEKKLPAIAFVFSKKYADELLKDAARVGKDLTTNAEKQKITEHIERYKKEYGLYTNNLNETALLKGYAIHSAAILPLQKQLIEELFNKRLIKVAFATETLAAGINMPAKTVIMTDYQKPSGDALGATCLQDLMRTLQPNEFHQMTGRAGRRGIDTTGYVVLVAQDDAAQNIFEELRLSKPNNIISAYKTDAASVTGFLENCYDISRMKHLLERSFFASAQNDDSKLKVKSHMQNINNYLNLLLQFGYVEKTKNGHELTPAGHLISEIKGTPQIPVITALLNNKFSHLTPVELAGIIGAIVVQPKVEVFPIQPLPSYSYQVASNTALNEINVKIHDKLKNDLKLTKVREYNTNEEIMAEIQRVYQDIINEDYDEISSLLESTNKKIESIERAIGNDKGFDAISKYKELEALQRAKKEIKHKRAILGRIRFLSDLLDSRTKQQESMANTMQNNLVVKNDAYNELVDDYNNYNEAAIKISGHLPKAQLNPLGFDLIYKWAERNLSSSDYQANWDYMCQFLNESGTIKYEGDLFNAIAQTIDFIHQLEGTVTHAQSIKGLAVQREDLVALKAKLKEAAKLLKQPPLYDIEDAKTKTSKN